MILAAGFKPAELSLLEKLRLLNWPFVLVVALVAMVGYGMLYSAGGGSHAPGMAAWRPVRSGRGRSRGGGVDRRPLLVSLRLPAYGAALLGLVAVEPVGQISMGAQRRLDLGAFQLQPSEVMKIALILALARYFHSAYLEDVARPLHLITPALMALVPATLVLKQPDLGTATMLLAGGAMFFLAGVRWRKFALLLGTGLITPPIAWQQLHDYQKQRIMTFLDAEQDPLGTGYHIIQSKIAPGSGGLWGKGFLKGTQSQLSFLPEKQTDFVFTMLAEEAGPIGALALLFLFLVLIGYGMLFAVRARSHFARLLGAGASP